MVRQYARSVYLLVVALGLLRWSELPLQSRKEFLRLKTIRSMHCRAFGSHDISSLPKKITPVMCSECECIAARSEYDMNEDVSQGTTPKYQEIYNLLSIVNTDYYKLNASGTRKDQKGFPGNFFISD